MDKYIELIEVLAAKLNVPVEYLWGILIKQAYVQSIINICTITVLTLLFILGWQSSTKYLKVLNDADSYNNDSIILLHAARIIAIIIGTFILLCLLESIGACLCNPDYWAFKQLKG